MGSGAGPRIVVTRRIPDPALELLHEAGGEVWVSPHDRPMTTEELHEAVAGADAIVTLLHDTVDEALLDAAGSQVAVIAHVAVGYDNVDVAAVIDRGIIFTNTPGVLTEATADIAFALMLMSTRRLAEGERLCRAGGTWSWNMFFMLGTGLQGKTLGIVGHGPDRHGHRPPGARFWHGDRLHGPAAGAGGAGRGAGRQLHRVARRPAGHGRRGVAALPALGRDTRHLIDARRLR